MTEIPAIILPVSYLPPISYFTCLVSDYPVIIETGETFPKQTLRNRCEITGSHGRQILIVPVSKPGGNHTKTYEVLASDHECWRKKHFRALETAYSSSPYFLYYCDRIKQMINTCPDNLAELDIFITRQLLELLGASPDIGISDGYLQKTGHALDHRQAFPKKGFSRGQSLEPYFQVYSHLNGFLADVSILDLLFNVGPGTLNYLKKSKAIISGYGV